MRPRYDVFISYRRKGGLELARCICYYLRSKGVRCFFDLKEINGGKFDDAIYDALDCSKYFLLLLTKGSLDRCVENDDWVRREIEYAMDKKDKCHQIVPVVVDDDGFKFPDVLPDGFLGLSTIQQETLDREQHFERDIDELLIRRMPRVGKKISRKFTRQARQREEAAENAFCERAREYKEDRKIRIDIGGGHEKLVRFAEELRIDSQRANILIQEVNSSVNRKRKRVAWMRFHPVLTTVMILFTLFLLCIVVYWCLPPEMREWVYELCMCTMENACSWLKDATYRFARLIDK